jgi:hypothetical protein
MSFWASALTSTGGLSYHYLALKYARSRWSQHRDQLERHLSEWPHFCYDLILIGPSGGYSLPVGFLKSFRHIYVYDPDPIAKRIFAWRFQNVPHTWSHSPILFTPGLDSKVGLDALKAHHPHAALLFCNILGQWPLLNSQLQPEETNEFALTLTQTFPGARWASYHDIFSGQVPLRMKVPSNVKIQNQTDIENFWRDVDGKNVVDHLTFGVFSNNRPTSHWSWSLMPRQLHLIEWVQGL